ncbi:MAG: thiamine-phosphate kinase [Xanthomonadales bacterium]|nr:thiamine-phosphate kinase [Xanthomonadales bacterium]
MSEFEFIARLQRRFDAHARSCKHAPVLGIGDDAAVLDIPNGSQVVVTTDTLVSAVHFFADDQPADIAAKALAASLSDLAAMGAEPAWFFLAVSLPQADLAWWDDFATGLLGMAQVGAIQLAGGDTTRGPLSITITAMGLVEEGKALRRDGARPGDLVVVSGQPGLAALALQQIQAGESAASEAEQALKRPQPRLTLGRVLIGQASACVDVSDGLMADLGHILKASECAAEIRLEQLARPAAMSGLDDATAWNLQLAGGDDYELCFTLPQQLEQGLSELQQKSGVALHVIGSIVAGSGVKLLRNDGQEFILNRSSYEHFSAKFP